LYLGKMQGKCLALRKMQREGGRIGDMKYIAHTENESGEYHRLKDHLLKTAEVAESFANIQYLKNLCKIEGKTHDLGKYLDAFQYYLINGGQRGSVPHAKYGAILYRLLHDQMQMSWAKEISFCIAGHHAGLPDYSDWKQNITDYNDYKVQKDYKTVLPLLLDDLNADQKDLFITETEKNMEVLDKELITRFLFSCLTDADWLDTERHFESFKYETRKAKRLNPERLIQILDKFFNQLSKDGKINKLRNQVRDFAVSKADKATGFFSLNLPTGMGKTFTSVYWALKHAQSNQLQRIIIVLPFVNIIDQTAQIFKERFGEEYVLEHHSGISENDDNDTKYDVRKLACENWDYPIVITTTVQFFESLFGNKPSKCRKIHNIADSVVIFDEVQSLPKELIVPTLTMLKNINKNLHSSFLFCTATLPAFQKRRDFEGLETIDPLVKNPGHIYRETKRVEYELINDLESITHDALFNQIKEKDFSALVVFNTKVDAYEFYHRLTKDKDSWYKLFHLSTAMCPMHRKSVISEIRSALQERKKIIVTSTQLIEAGVDFDFPSVYRAMAPLDSIIQTAGRCNREGKMPGYGKAYIFKPDENRMPDKTYNAISVHASNMIKNNLNRLDEYDFYGEYYEQIISLYIDPDSRKINEERRRYNFSSIAKQYRIIDSLTYSLLIHQFDTSSEMFFERIKYKEKLSKNDFRKMQLYSVQVYEIFIHKFKNWIVDMPQGFKVWYGDYDDETGISLNENKNRIFIV